MRSLLTILLFISLSVKAQSPFKPGVYTKGTLVKDSSGNVWKAKKDLTAKAYPKAGTSWEKVEPDFGKMIKSLRDEMNAALIKITMLGFPLVNIKNDSTVIIRSLVPGKGIKITPTDSTLIISQ